MAKKGTRYCGIIFIGSGSSWGWADTPEEAAKIAAKSCKADWGDIYKIGKMVVHIYDMKNHEGWEATCHAGVCDIETGEPIPLMKTISVA